MARIGWGHLRFDFDNGRVVAALTPVSEKPAYIGELIWSAGGETITGFSRRLLIPAS